MEKNVKSIWEEDFWNEQIETKPRKIKKCIEHTDKPKKSAVEVNVLSGKVTNNKTVKKSRDIDQLDGTSFDSVVNKQKYQKLHKDADDNDDDTERKGDSFKNWFPYQNAQVAKMFNNTIHYGVITAYKYEKNTKHMSDEGYPMIWYWHVHYEDGDEEDLNLKELYDGLNLFQASPRKRSKKLPKIILEPSKNECSETEHDNDDDYYDVKMILDRRTIKRHGGIEGIQYLVQWKDTWINAERLPPNLLQKAFKKFDLIDDVDEMEITTHDNESNSSSENHRESEDSLETHSSRILNESDYEDRGGCAELVVNGKTFRIGTSYKRGEHILTIINILKGEQLAECKKYSPFTHSFLGRSNMKQRRKLINTYCEHGETETIPLACLSCIYRDKFVIFDWLYDISQNDGFCYYKREGKIPPSTPEKLSPTVLELYAGAGGMSLGFKNAGMQVKWAVEHDSDAQATLKANFGSSGLTVYPSTVREFLRAVNDRKGGYPQPGEVDHIHGSPPCQGFSYNNPEGKGNAMENNDQTMEFLKAIERFEPNTVTYENVPGLRSDKHRHYLEKLVSGLIDMNYQVRLAELRASDFGDPQHRKRIFLFAAKVHMCIPSSPIATHSSESQGGLLKWRTLEDAIGWLKNVQPSDDPNIATYLNGIHDFNHCIGPGDRILQGDEHVSSADKPARTVLCKPFIHYNGRYTTVRENACVQSFPWDFQFHGTTTKQFKQVGNAVPIMLATQVARSVAKVYGLP